MKYLARMDGIKTQLLASASLALGGFILICLGIYFIFLRPPLLPEDLRYIGTSLAQIQNNMPELQSWLSRVFGVLGGYMIATGLLTIYISATSFWTGATGVKAIICASGLSSIGWMVITNFIIQSDFKWLLAVFSLPWIIALICSLISTKQLQIRK